MEKDLFDLFRDGEHQLDERPSSAAWRRLETKLDGHQKEQRQTFMRQLLSVAAVLLLLMMVGGIWFVQMPAKAVVASSQSPTVLEELSGYANYVEEPKRVMEFTQKHISRLSNPVDDGPASKKLIPKK